MWSKLYISVLHKSCFHNKLMAFLNLSRRATSPTNALHCHLNVTRTAKAFLPFSLFRFFIHAFTRHTYWPSCKDVWDWFQLRLPSCITLCTDVWEQRLSLKKVTTETDPQISVQTVSWSYPRGKTEDFSNNCDYMSHVVAFGPLILYIWIVPQSSIVRLLTWWLLWSFFPQIQVQWHLEDQQAFQGRSFQESKLP